jgi:hypothetical protein
MRIQETKIMRIHADADADPQHCPKGLLFALNHRRLISKFKVNLLSIEKKR